MKMHHRGSNSVGKPLACLDDLKAYFHTHGIPRIFYFILLKSWDFTVVGIIPGYFAKAGISIYLLVFGDFITIKKQMCLDHREDFKVIVVGHSFVGFLDVLQHLRGQRGL